MDRMNSIEFLRYITTPLTLEEMNLLYKANNIRFDKCELYHDFIKTLNHLIVNTYLGDDVVLTDEDKKKHYLWCFKQIIKDFYTEGIIFDDLDDLKHYFYHYYEELFYLSDDKDNSLIRLNKLANISFVYSKIKTRSDMDILLELYKLFEKSLNFKLKT